MVAKKNKGRTYLSVVYEKAGLSPGKFYKRQAASVDRKRKRNNELKTSKESKRRKLKYTQEKTVSQRTNELREGTTYQSHVDLNHNASQADLTTRIPPAVKHPVTLSLSDKIMKDSKFVFFDLETTSFEKDCGILQIGACDVAGNQFSQYVIPEKDIGYHSEQVHGIHYNKMTGTLSRGGNPIAAKPWKEVANLFVTWLQNIGRCVLIAQNCRSFDAMRLFRSMSSVGMIQELESCVSGFIDTLPFFRKTYPELKKPKGPGHSQESVYKRVVGGTYSAHDAMADSLSLMEIVTKMDETASMSNIRSHFPTYMTVWPKIVKNT